MHKVQCDWCNLKTIPVATHDHDLQIKLLSVHDYITVQSDIVSCRVRGSMQDLLRGLEMPAKC